MSIFSQLEWVSFFCVLAEQGSTYPLSLGAFGLVWSANAILAGASSTSCSSSRSSAKDQLTGQAVAIKKIMKPFSTAVLSKRTYRELKLLKHIQHENVSHFCY